MYGSWAKIRALNLILPGNEATHMVVSAIGGATVVAEAC
jgi:hypothetical protein